MATDVSTVEVGGEGAAPTLRRDLAVPFYKRLDRVVARKTKQGGQRKRKRTEKQSQTGATGLRAPGGRGSEGLHRCHRPPATAFEGSVFYMFQAAVNLLSVVAAPPCRAGDARGGSTIVLVPTIPVDGAPIAVTCADRSDKSARQEARAVVRDVMAAGRDLFCQRTRAEFTSAFEIASERDLTVAQCDWAWTNMTEDLRLRWAYSAFRIRYLT